MKIVDGMVTGKTRKGIVVGLYHRGLKKRLAVIDAEALVIVIQFCPPHARHSSSSFYSSGSPWTTRQSKRLIFDTRCPILLTAASRQIKGCASPAQEASGTWPRVSALRPPPCQRRFLFDVGVINIMSHLAVKAPTVVSIRSNS